VNSSKVDTDILEECDSTSNSVVRVHFAKGVAMGAGQSAARKATVENPDESAVRITENVVDRLQRISVDTQREPTSSRAATATPAEAAYVTSQALRREVDRGIAENEAHWQSRMRALRDSYREISDELEAEYTKATEQVDRSLGENSVASGVAANLCLQSRDSVVQCYTRNQDQPLLCSSQVLKFNECVSNRSSLTVRAN